MDNFLSSLQHETESRAGFIDFVFKMDSSGRVARKVLCFYWAPPNGKNKFLNHFFFMYIFSGM